MKKREKCVINSNHAKMLNIKEKYSFLKQKKIIIVFYSIAFNQLRIKNSQNFVITRNVNL